ncbi:winged helix DNA-binding domain-containing protein [Fodinicola acaciae]|uniref:winged helix DNA-binding domain-containing protein n=1 Tax=Fodinicola acaciae TaxID=2681555 RepID=UPI0013CFDC01|nr:winged helix DNA-binding domain-containing protein [Fodinicola acaciae]
MSVRIGVEQRRARLATRHCLAPAARVAGTAEIAEAMVALHASDPATVYLSVLSRIRKPDPDEVDRAMYDDRSVLRILGMRRTLFVVPVATVPVIHEAAARKVGEQQRKLLVKLLDQVDIDGDKATWLNEVEEATYEALHERGQATAAQLSAAVPRLRTPIVMSEGKPYEAKVNITGRVLILLAADGRIVRGPTGGSSWSSRLYTWSTMRDWLGAPPPPIDADEANRELARRWLRTFGPAPVGDLKWWTGWPLTQTRKVLASLDVVEVDLDGQPGVALADDLEPAPRVRPWAALLPGLDPTPMGWQERGWFLGDHGPRLFDNNGNIGPTVWWDGRIVGGWAQRDTGEIAYELLEDVGSDAVKTIEAEVAKLATAIGDRRITPAFRTPLERELSGVSTGKTDPARGLTS